MTGAISLCSAKDDACDVSDTFTCRLVEVLAHLAKLYLANIVCFHMLHAEESASAEVTHTPPLHPSRK